MNIGCRIVEDFERPSKELIELYREFPVANIDDCMNRTAAIHQDIRPMNSARLLGPAFTVKVPEGDNLMFHKAMDMAREGDVIVIDAGGITSRAIFGELMLTYCKSRGIAGVIVDGSIRDKDAISKMDIPVYARGITPDGPYKNGPGEINTVISFGGQVVRPGDLIIGDEDGVIVVKPEEAAELAEKVKAVSNKEMDIMDKILNEGTYIRPWVDEKLAEIGCETW
jgi:RraA family protein